MVSAQHFDTWWKRARQHDPGLLTLGQQDLAGPAADEVDADTDLVGGDLGPRVQPPGGLRQDTRWLDNAV